MHGNSHLKQLQAIDFKGDFLIKFLARELLFHSHRIRMREPTPMNSLIALATAIALTLLAGAAFANFQNNQQQATATQLVQQMRATPVQFEHATNVEPGQFAAKPLSVSEWQPRPQQRFTF
jgi:hypothetical protein